MTTTHDPRDGRYGGAEYGAQQDRSYNDPRGAPQPTMRPAPQSYGQPQQVQVPAEHMLPQHQAAPVYAAPDAPSPAPSDASVLSNVVTLSRAYRAHGEDVRRIEFRQPTTADLRKCGYPLRNVIDRSGTVTGIDELPDVVAKYITLLATPALPPSTVNELSLDDFAKCSTVVLNFFI